MKQGVAYLTFSSVIFVLSGYAINIWLGKTLGPTEYGLYGIVIGLLSTINLFQTAGLPQATAKFIAGNHKLQNSILSKSLWLQLISTLLLSLIYLALARPLAWLLHDLRLVPYLRLSALILPFYGIFALYSGYYNGRQLFAKQALINIIYSTVKLIAVIGLTSLFRLRGALLGFILAPIVAAASGFRWPKFQRLKFSAKKLIRFAIPLVAFGFFSLLQQTVDLYFVKGLTLSDKLTGFYTADQNIARIPLVVLSAFSGVLFPTISKYVSEDNPALINKIISRSLHFALIILIPASVAISTTSDRLIQLLFSSDYLPAAPALSILVFSLALITLFTLLANILNGAGNPSKSAWLAAVGVIISSILCIFLIPRYGLVGAALSTGFSGLMTTLAAALLVQRKFIIVLPAKNVVKILLSTLPLYVLTGYLNWPLVLLPLNYFLAGLSYIVCLILFKALTKQDLEIAVSLIPFLKLQKIFKKQ